MLFCVRADSIHCAETELGCIPGIWEPIGRGVATSQFATTEDPTLQPLLPRGIDRRFLKYLRLDPKMRSGLEGMATGSSGFHQRVRPRDVLRSPTSPYPELNVDPSSGPSHTS